MESEQYWPPGERIATWASSPSIQPSPEPFYAQCQLCGKRHPPAPEISRAVHVE